MTKEQRLLVRAYLEMFDVLHNGMCYGADEECLKMFDESAASRSSQLRVVGHPPTNRSGMTRFRPVQCHLEMRESFPYLVRDEHIVQECHMLIATPAEPNEIMQSGTWATIRRARKHYRDHYIICPNGVIRVVRYKDGKPLEWNMVARPGDIYALVLATNVTSN